MDANDCRADGLGLSPFVIVALDPPARPVERLMGLQMATSRLIGWIAGLRLPRRSDRGVAQAAPLLAKN